jgi:FkbM family methyltransferase
MSYINKQNTYREWFTNKLQGLVYRLDNTGNGDLMINGELNFTKALNKFYTNKSFIFFDIGANRGDYTEMILNNIFPSHISIHIFEPQKTCVHKLATKFNKNSNITINNFGFSDEVKKAELYKDFDQSGLASVYKRNLEHYNISINNVENISLKRASDYIKEKTISEINLIKIDVEGHELNVLHGFDDFISTKNIDFVQFEYGGANLDSHTSLLELYRYFEHRGFIMCKMMPKSLKIRKYHPRLENYMYANYVAVNPKFCKII